VKRTVIEEADLVSLKVDDEFASIFTCEISSYSTREKAMIKVNAFDHFCKSMQEMQRARKKNSKEILDASVAEILTNLKYHVKQQKMKTSVPKNSGDSQGQVSEKIISQFKKLSIQNSFFLRGRRAVQAVKTLDAKLAACESVLVDLQRRLNDEIDSDDEEDGDGITVTEEIRTGMAQLLRLQGQLQKKKELTRSGFGGAKGGKKGGVVAKKTGAVYSHSAKGGGLNRKRRRGDDDEDKDKEKDDSEDSAANMDTTSTTSDNAKKSSPSPVKEAHKRKNRMCRAVIKRFLQKVARQEQKSGGSELRGDGDLLQEKSLWINMTHSCWVLANNACKEKNMKAAEGVEEMSGGGEEEESSEKKASTCEDDIAFYHCQESFQLHLQGMDLKDLLMFRKELKLELKKLRRAQFYRQKGMHYAHSIAHCRLLGSGGTYSFTQHSAKEWKEGAALRGTKTGSYAHTLAMARGVSIRFWVFKRYAIEVIGPPEHYSSQECPFCLTCKKVGSERRFVCSKCGIDTHRDLCKATGNQTQRVIAMGFDVLRAILPAVAMLLLDEKNSGSVDAG
jgi:hypothetical protein